MTSTIDRLCLPADVMAAYAKALPAVQARWPDLNVQGGIFRMLTQSNQQVEKLAIRVTFGNPSWEWHVQIHYVGQDEARARLLREQPQAGWVSAQVSALEPNAVVAMQRAMRNSTAKIYDQLAQVHEPERGLDRAALDRVAQDLEDAADSIRQKLRARDVAEEMQK